MMKEEFIAYLWKNCLLQQESLYTTDHEQVRIVDPGLVNNDAGPDFFTSKVRINKTLWVGNLEIHVLASDWYRHEHHLDPAYDNIILHVAYEHDREVFNSQGKRITCLEIKNHFQKHLLNNYMDLKHARSWVPCQNSLSTTDGFILRSWLSRLLAERLERKSEEIRQYLQYFTGDWEKTFYFMLARNFGFKVNASPFGLLIQRTPMSLLHKNRDNQEVLEAILFGQAGMLGKVFHDEYPQRLQAEYAYRQKIYGLKPVDGSLWKFCRMRPANFPTIRIAQIAKLLHQEEKLFERCLQATNKQQLTAMLKVTASDYWTDHYQFDVASVRKVKQVGPDTLENILINTMVPMMFLYGQETIKPALTEKAIDLLHEISPENNLFTRKWRSLGIEARNAADSQALIELKKNYCSPRKCLRCHIGNQIVRRIPG